MHRLSSFIWLGREIGKGGECSLMTNIYRNEGVEF